MIGKLGIFAALLFLILLLMRLGDIATLGWWAVTAPLWIYGALCAFVIVLFYVLKIEHHGSPE